MSIEGINNTTNINPVDLMEYKINNENKFAQILEQVGQTIEQSDQDNNSDQNKAKLMDVCRELESIFVHQMISQMRSSIPQEGYITQSSAEKIFQDMLDQEYAKKISHAGGLGLAEMLYRQLSTERS